ncbi:MAG: SUMF1/EgtB/PvdO family nonheme iron enzyme [Hyphomonas sp.]|nr:SUMF1/EgtB/PvdO family nonheme iron enzyme [Hyphomonas sp.]
MADIFISYSQPDHAQVQALAADLVRRGYSVWWDTSLLGGDRFRPEIARELMAAACVVVVWSRNSVASEWVVSEAEHARSAGKLLPVRTENLNPASIPMPFGIFHTELLTQRERIVAAVERLRSGPTPAQTLPHIAHWPDGSVPADSLGPDPIAGTEFRDLPEAPVLVVVPSGGFRMGSAAREAGRDASESPQHFVRIAHKLAVGKYPVTFREWDHFSESTRSAYRAGDAGFGRGDRPVINVSWHDALTYCEWLGVTSGQRYRLLTEAEWEFCCRAGTTTRYAFGDLLSAEQANFNASAHPQPGSANTFRGRSIAAGSFKANGFGLHDMHGNVGEWVHDTWHDDYDGAPGDGRAWNGTGARRVTRGGSWYDYPHHVRSARRSWAVESERAPNIGFRVCRELELSGD